MYLRIQDQTQPRLISPAVPSKKALGSTGYGIMNDVMWCDVVWYGIWVHMGFVWVRPLKWVKTWANNRNLHIKREHVWTPLDFGAHVQPNPCHLLWLSHPSQKQVSSSSQLLPKTGTIHMNIHQYQTASGSASGVYRRKYFPCWF